VKRRVTKRDKQEARERAAALETYLEYKQGTLVDDEGNLVTDPAIASNIAWKRGKRAQALRLVFRPRRPI
jgi:hypothetical protein